MVIVGLNVLKTGGGGGGGGECFLNTANGWNIGHWKICVGGWITSGIPQ